MFQAQKASLEAQLAHRNPDPGRRSRKALGMILREDVAKANQRFNHARDNDLISSSDGDDFETELEGSSSGQTVRAREKSRIGDQRSEMGFEESEEDSHNSSELAVNIESPITSTGVSGSLPTEMIAETDSFSVQSDLPQWKIQIHKPPVSATVRCGPMKWSQLSRNIGLDKATASTIKRRSLLSNDEPNLGLRIAISGDMAFIYDAIFLEDMNTPATYLLDWGLRENNENIIQYIHERNSSAFHTFVYILKPKRWYYVGVQKWTQTELDWDIWGKIGEQDRLRSRVVQHLNDHCGNQIDRGKIEEMMDNGALKQVCVRFHGGHSHSEASRDMCRRMNYVPPS
ncbi:hypothetical protein BDP27DRAFT_704552 [Rhodocollybia butyracea]|uniref:Uncharacterized protein n=1 Tax=Rhodocollybia butyracea TaxID=206335 RepID=A0A9P5Q8S0_9AGAR|nr:hypothetical protein BDP27DRAFT_704552 [Rhodocollybia butyracea]